MDKYATRSIARADPELAFDSFVGFNGHHCGVFRADSPGAALWEMHPDTDEFLHSDDPAAEPESG